MVIETLKKDLIDIFQVPKVVIADLSFGAEQDIIYCQINKIVSDIHTGVEFSEAQGSISMVAASEEKLPSEWLHQRIALIPKRLNQKFFFNKSADTIPFVYADKILSRYQIGFIYFNTQEFNPQKEMQGVKYNNETQQGA
ncbi:MAG: hypothetical protein LBV16_09355 [Elusimicrobiota bacterium]|jgi:hypothetical protein|nr:hypothetical protein [Elusimicrobiota bacterium]